MTRFGYVMVTYFAAMGVADPTPSQVADAVIRDLVSA